MTMNLEQKKDGLGERVLTQTADVTAKLPPATVDICVCELCIIPH